MKNNIFKTLLISAFVCSSSIISLGQNAELTPLFELDNAAITSISENGEWACGAAFNNNDNAGYQSNASKWNLKTHETCQQSDQNTFGKVKVLHRLLLFFFTQCSRFQATGITDDTNT